jgi:hypothetical protein
MKKFNPVWLPYMGAFVQAILFGLAGYKYFNLGLWGAAAGLGVGAVVNLSMAVASSRISDIAKSRKLLAYLSLIGLFALSPVIICSSLGWSLANLSWSLAADLSITLTGAIAGKSLISHDAPQKLAEQPAQIRSAKKKSAQKPLSEIPCRYAGAGCDRTFAKQNAANAHARSCGFKPTIAMPVDVSQKAVKR